MTEIPNTFQVSGALVHVLPQMTAAALKVYIYLCDLQNKSEGRPFTAAVPQICGATGLKQRSVKSSLKVLEQTHLVTRRHGSGGRPNTYEVWLHPDADMDQIQTPAAPAPAEKAPERAAVEVPAAPSISQQHTVVTKNDPPPAPKPPAPARPMERELNYMERLMKASPDIRDVMRRL